MAISTIKNSVEWRTVLICRISIKGCRLSKQIRLALCKVLFGSCIASNATLRKLQGTWKHLHRQGAQVQLVNFGPFKSSPYTLRTGPWITLPVSNFRFVLDQIWNVAFRQPQTVHRNSLRPCEMKGVFSKAQVTWQDLFLAEIIVLTTSGFERPLSRVGPYRFCSGGTLDKPSSGYRFGHRFRLGPYWPDRFCSDGNPTSLFQYYFGRT